MTKKEVLKALSNKRLNPFYLNNSLYESVYCSIVQHNDTISELKTSLKCWREEKPHGDYYTTEHIAEQIADIKEQIKEYRRKRKDLQKASALLFGDNFAEYNE